MSEKTITTITCDQCKQQLDIGIAEREGWLVLRGVMLVDGDLDFCGPGCLKEHLETEFWKDYDLDIIDRSMEPSGRFVVHTERLKILTKKVIESWKDKE